MRMLDVSPLTAETFAPFGDLIEAGGGELVMINSGKTERHHDLANVDVADDEELTPGQEAQFHQPPTKGAFTANLDQTGVGFGRESV